MTLSRLLAERDYISADELAHGLRVSRRTVSNWRSRGIVPPPVQLSARCVRFSSVAIRDWLEQRSHA